MRKYEWMSKLDGCICARQIAPPSMHNHACPVYARRTRRNGAFDYKRDQILCNLEVGLSVREVALKWSVSKSTVYRIQRAGWPQFAVPISVWRKMNYGESA